MSRRANAPYQDEIEPDGRTLIYEGHDAKRTLGIDPKAVDQPLVLSSGVRTTNGKFFDAATRAAQGLQQPHRVRVYEKLRDGVWVYQGEFDLIDAWLQQSGARQVCKFKLVLREEDGGDPQAAAPSGALPHTRLIPTAVKILVWQRDGGKCVRCGSRENLHFDHVIPFWLGGSSAIAENIQLLCATHNLSKSDSIQ